VVVTATTLGKKQQVLHNSSAFEGYLPGLQCWHKYLVVKMLAFIRAGHLVSELCASLIGFSPSGSKFRKGDNLPHNTCQLWTYVFCVCSDQSELRNSAFESYKKPSSRSASQTDLDHSDEQLQRFVLLQCCLYFVYTKLVFLSLLFLLLVMVTILSVLIGNAEKIRLV